jgi:hypothetical protein
VAITRANPYLAEYIEILDIHRGKYSDDDEARGSLSKADNEFIDEEIVHCLQAPRYFISNYYAIRTEDKGFQGLYPFFDSQEILHDEYRKLEKKNGKVKALVLKARQMGSTTYNCAEFFAKTIFSSHMNSIIVAQDEDQASYIFGMYESALDFIPWWMRPRIKIRQTGKVINFDEKDDTLRLLRPGLKTWVYADNGRKPTGVGRGKTFQRALLSELSAWANPEQLSKSLFPTFNTPDGFYVMESTANGRNDAWHNLWRDAESGDNDWYPIFIPYYRRAKTYSLPISKKEEFVLTEDEKAMRDRVAKAEGFTISDETFNWARKKKREFASTSKEGDDSMFYQEYTSTPEESFQASAVTAFPRAIIRRFSKNTKNPQWVGEIGYNFDSNKPKLHMREVTPFEKLRKPSMGERLHMFERVIPGYEYCVGGDVALGNPGGDYSCCQVIKKGKGMEKDEQVAVWHGLISPGQFAEICIALGFYYNEALLAVEVNSFGIQTNSICMRNYEYPNLYRYKHLDKIKHSVTDTTGFWSTPKTTDALMADMSEAFLEDTIQINCRFTMDEFNDFTEEGAKGSGAHDDYVDAIMIALYCAYEMQRRNRREGVLKKKVPETANEFIVVDRNGTVMLQTNSQTQAEQFSKRIIGTTIRRNAGAKADLQVGEKTFKIPADFQNTEFSILHDKDGPAKQLYDDGIPGEDITPEMIAEYEGELEEPEEDTENAWKYY